jgi:uncharacterized protein (TIGR00730 family)
METKNSHAVLAGLLEIVSVSDSISKTGPLQPSAGPFPGSSGDREFDRRVQELVHDWRPSCAEELIHELIYTALRLGKDGLSAADLKLFNRTLKELRAAARVFAPYESKRKVAVFGSARTAPSALEYKLAEEFGRRMRELGYMIVTGGGEGIMGAAQKGAGRRHSFGLNIRLPFEQRANETILGDKKLVNFNYFFTRKVNFLKGTHAIALFPGGFGTMDEGFEALTLMQTGKMQIIPLVLVDRADGLYWKGWERFLRDHLLANGLVSADDFHLFKVFTDMGSACEEITNFYRIYHSARWVRHRLVFRLNRRLSREAIHSLNTEFSSLLISGRFEQRHALPEEESETALADLPRLVCHPHRSNFGKLRALIDRINMLG